MELYTITSQEQILPLGAYAGLIKSSLILIDLVACHPQVPALAARKNADVQLLSAELKNELGRLALLKLAFPCLDQLQGTRCKDLGEL
jgi:hypothetical protein